MSSFQENQVWRCSDTLKTLNTRTEKIQPVISGSCMQLLGAWERRRRKKSGFPLIFERFAMKKSESFLRCSKKITPQYFFELPDLRKLFFWFFKNFKLKKALPSKYGHLFLVPIVQVDLRTILAGQGKHAGHGTIIFSHDFSLFFWLRLRK